VSQRRAAGVTSGYLEPWRWALIVLSPPSARITLPRDGGLCGWCWHAMTIDLVDAAGRHRGAPSSRADAHGRHAVEKYDGIRRRAGRRRWGSSLRPLARAALVQGSLYAAAA